MECLFSLNREFPSWGFPPRTIPSRGFPSGGFPTWENTYSTFRLTCCQAFRNEQFKKKHVDSWSAIDFKMFNGTLSRNDVTVLFEMSLGYTFLPL